MTNLKISDDFSIPQDAITQTFGILAVRGAGKSNTAAVMAEEMYEKHLPFVVIDPVGAWWGLRSSGDGKAAGIPIPIFGGLHGDVPLERSAGLMIADLVVDQRLSCILDVSDFSEGDKIKFLCDFAERLYRRNSEPLHLFLEEADDYIPQRPMHEQARLLRAFENIVRRGRARGLGITMISQRSAALNKNVLTQIETLFVMRTTSPQDRKAIAGWVEYYAQDKELLKSLPELKSGQAWVWSPQWLGAVKRVNIRRRWTFDSGATPRNKAASGRKPATLADVDLDQLRTNMTEAIERAKQEDPKELRAQIQHLKHELEQKPKAIEVPKEIQIPVISAEQMAQISEVLEALEAEVKGIANLEHQLKQINSAVVGTADNLKQTLAGIQNLINQSKPRQVPGASRLLPRAASIVRTTASVTSRQVQEDPDGKMTRPQLRILEALSWLESVRIYDPKRTVVAFLASQSSKSSGFTNNLSTLRSAGTIEYLSDGRMKLTEAGRGYAQPSEQPLTTAQLQDAVLSRLPKPQARILEVLIQEYPKSILRSEVAERVGQSIKSSGFTNNLSSLRSFDLIDYPDAERAVVLPLLFLEN